jgi:hypothetical protein
MMRTEGTGGEGYIGDDFYRGGNDGSTFMKDGEALISIGGVVVEVTGSKVFPKEADGGRRIFIDVFLDKVPKIVAIFRTDNDILIGVDVEEPVETIFSGEGEGHPHVFELASMDALDGDLR